MALFKYKDGSGNFVSIPAIKGDPGTTPVPQTGTVAPSGNASYVGQLYVNTVGLIGYVAVQIGTGATDWKQITNV